MNKKYKNMLEYIKEGALNFVFPLNCEICQKPIRESKGYSICEDCFNRIEFIEKPYCVKCGKPLIKTEFFLKNKDILCADCRKEKYSFKFARSVTVYNKILKKFIHLYKYYNEKKLADPLGKLLINYLLKCKEFEKIDLLIPVPMHKNDLRKRGFNQSVLLGRKIGNYFSIPIEEKILIKEKSTPFQINLSKKERKKNLIKVFSVKEPEKFENKNILIVDDVFTTGSTVNECAKEIKKAKAKNIFVLTLARSITELNTVFP